MVTVDRFSNLPTVSSAKPGTPSSGTKDLLGAFYSLFVTFGILEEISSEGQSIRLVSSGAGSPPPAWR